jgi:hypothetical protein
MQRSVIWLVVVIVLGAGAGALLLSQRGGPTTPERDDSSSDPTATGASEAVPNPPTEAPVAPPIPDEEVHPVAVVTRLWADAALGKGLAPRDAETRVLLTTEDGARRLLGVIAEASDREVACAAVLMLGMNPTEIAHRAVFEIATGRYGNDLRTAGIYALQNQSSEVILPFLTDLAAVSSDLGIASAALQVISVQDQDFILDRFEEVLLRAPDDVERRKLVYSALGGVNIFRKTDEPEIIQILRKQRPGVGPLGAEPSPEMTEWYNRFLDVALKESDPSMRRAVGHLAAVTPGERASKVLAEVYRGSAREAKRELLDLSHPDRTPDKLAYLIDELKAEPDLELRREACRSLGASWDPNAVDALLRWQAEEQDEYVLAAIKDALWRIQKMDR